MANTQAKSYGFNEGTASAAVQAELVTPIVKTYFRKIQGAVICKLSDGRVMAFEELANQWLEYPSMLDAFRELTITRLMEQM